jgi:hypothetical protein
MLQMYRLIKSGQQASQARLINSYLFIRVYRTVIIQSPIDRAAPHAEFLIQLYAVGY